METINVLYTVNTFSEFFSKTKDLFRFLCNKIPPKDAAGKQTFLHCYFSKTKSKPLQKIQGDIFLLIESHSKNSGTFEERKHTKSSLTCFALAWFALIPSIILIDCKALSLSLS